ncbi:MAG: NAD(P)H-hydrate dehydratase [Ignavibacteriae bacterium]|nr:MAG: NAD(P)H-hydrate dehydratase [Ignavibacteriota bacterium]
MQRIVSAEEMRWCDETAIKSCGIPGLLLMENAGRSIADVLKQKFPQRESRKVLVVCGKGNNGGDGFVIARLISNSCARVDVLLVPAPSELKGDAKVNYAILQKLAGKSSSHIRLLRYSKKILSSLSQSAKPDIIIDALFGTGFTGPVRKPYTDIIEWINKQELPVVSADIPSGVNGTTGVVENCSVQADITVTLGVMKSGLLCNQGREVAGAVSVADIGIPRAITEDQRLKTALVDKEDVRRTLPRRSIHAHKYSVGKVLVLAGSKGLTGAAALCSTAAMRAGAGAVVLGTPEPVYSILARKMTEVMTTPLPATDQGTLSLNAIDGIRERLSWSDVLLIGPGLSQNPETQELIFKLLLEYHGKILVDADGLNAIAARGVSKFRSARASLILTPHVGEFSRLINIPPIEVERHRIESARILAKRLNAVVVLKGVPTVTASSDGSCILNSTGNPGMATAGSGDVLSGIIAGLWAQGMSDEEAAYASVYLHGLAGDLAAKKMGERSLLAQDLIQYLPAAMQLLS